MHMTTNEQAIQYSQTEATEEALRLFMRKVARLHPEAHADVLSRLPQGAREALAMAELRADTLFITDRRDGVIRSYPTAFEDSDEDAGD
jgi:hypothetical protein